MKYVIILTAYILSSLHVNANEIDFKFFKEKFPYSESVVLNKDVRVEFFINETTSELNASVIYNISVLALKNDVSSMQVVQLPFNTYQGVDVLSAKYYLLDTLGIPKVKQRVKTKYIEEKDYFINGIFYNDLKVKQFACKKNIIEKNVLNYSYKETYTDVKFLTRIFAQRYLQHAVDSFSLTVSAPYYVDYDLIPFNIKGENLKFSSKEVEGNIEKTYSLSNIPTWTNTELMAPASYVLPHFMFHIKEYTDNGATIRVLKTVNDQYAWYKGLIDDLNQDSDFISKLAKKIIGNETVEEKKIELIYKWMQTNIQYVAFEDGIAGFKPDEAQDVCAKLYGDCKGMANVLVELLQSQGFSAHHTWIGTRSLPYDYSVPSLAVDNHMICMLNWNNEVYFLDATDKSTQWNVASSHIQGKTALVAKGDDFVLLKVPISEAKKNKVDIKATIGISNSSFSPISGSIELNGLIRNRYSNYIKYAGVQSKTLVIQSVVRRYFDDFIVDKGSVSLTDNGSVMTIQFKGKLTGIHTLNDKEIDVYPNLGYDLRSFLKQDSVDYPVYVDNRFLLNYAISYQFEIGFKQSKLPSSVNLSYNNGVSHFESHYAKDGKTISYTSSLLMNKELILVNELPEWNIYMINLRSAVYQPLIQIK
jgi:hypothetical protein